MYDFRIFVLIKFLKFLPVFIILAILQLAFVRNWNAGIFMLTKYGAINIMMQQALLFIFTTFLGIIQ